MNSGSGLHAEDLAFVVGKQFWNSPGRTILECNRCQGSGAYLMLPMLEC